MLPPIPDSELILNADGSVYHLNLLPEDIADTIITVGDPERVAAVSKYFDSIEVIKQKREFVTHTGYLNKQRLTVMSTGMGTDNIDIFFNELDALVNIDLSTRTIKERLRSLNIIRVGTSGSLQADIPLDSYVVTEYAVGLEGLLHFYNMHANSEEIRLATALLEHFPAGSLPINPYVAAGSTELVQLFTGFAQLGITATCGGFFAPQGRVLRAGLRYPHLLEWLRSFQYQQQRITNFEMETAGMYGMAKLLNHRCCSINAIITNRIAKRFSQRAAELVDTMIQLTLEQIAHTASLPEVAANLLNNVSE